ncbi:MAG TPA: saccharopine dehydrogenase NADP-binding domain-containing protein [Lacibacter sp.]|nr:saccharopine dehydrogenase NADP-binding domain-containing protein [Lacibacter sp.]HMO89414.1 saccharopine dehydrogenase NADP-binding domain-containing protein [Lacibacter sp.]HMP86344.1 saccharopine dehydrogenase NADP-binding domain-containing protein [Lacibacter sp.]
MAKDKILLYGANGYTGRLIADYADGYKLPLILAGRNAAALREMAAKHQLTSVVCSLDDRAQLEKILQDVCLVIHAAGPFAHTARQMVEACLATGTHYMDINGDLTVFEFIKSYHAAAVQANIMLIPGAGFDVVPTDCTALYLQQQLTDANQLELAFITQGGGISHGTATTMASKLGEGGAERRKGVIVKRPLGEKHIWLTVSGKKRLAVSIPWGDVATAHTTTGIPDITTYTGVTPGMRRMLKWQKLFNGLLRSGWMRRLIQHRIDSSPPGPTADQRARARTYVWGRVRNAAGQEASADLFCADGYTFTAHSCLLLAQKIASGNWKPGYQTPAGCYGAGLVWEVPGTVTAMADWQIMNTAV